MRIGIDAKWYFEGPASGQRVVRSLVDHLLKIDKENTYFIILNRKHRARTFPNSGNKNVQLCYAWAGNNMLSNVFVLPFLSRKHKFDVLLYQNFASPWGVGKSIAYIHDVLFLSNPEYYTIYERLYFAPLRFLTRRAHGIITVSEEEKKRLVRFRFSDSLSKIGVAYHGVDVEFLPRELQDQSALNATKNRFHLPDKFLLFVGRLNLRKNIDNLLRAIPLLKDKEVPLVIVGADDWMKSNHVKIVKELGIEERIQFVGAVYGKELALIYALSHIFCFPSNAESFGLPPLEAMASGVPVVVSNTTSLPEICGEAGNYVSPESQQEIATAIDNLLINDQLYSDKRQKGLLQAKLFTWERSALSVLQYMEACLKDN